MAYSVTLSGQAEKAIGAFDKRLQRRVKSRVLALADQPRPSGHSKLTGFQNLYRIRVGDYRIVYRVNDETQSVEVARVAHRREVYRDL